MPVYYLEGMEPSPTMAHSQVYSATHKGEQYLPFMYRSFVSFSFGGKNIEDFNLIATIGNNRISRPGYSKFNDITSKYDTLDGELYWNTHYNRYEITFNLSTDGIEQKMLDEFMRWFRAGEIRELVLAEHPNRAIMARVSDAPSISLLPFEQDVEMKISNMSYTTKTTLYRGEITLTLVSEDPFWYAIHNILGVEEDSHYKDKWRDANGTTVSIFASKDALKILYEDGVPLGSMIENSMLLGDGAYANVDSDIRSCIWDEESETTIANTANLEGGGACIDGTVGNVTYRGFIAGALIDISGNGVEVLYANEPAYFFYAGTAPSPLSIEFTTDPTLDYNNYVINPSNYHGPTSDAYSSIIIKSLNTVMLDFTTPNLYTSYNKVLDIFAQNISGSTTKSWEDIRKLVRTTIRHAGVRAWAMKVIEANESTTITSASASTLQTQMSYMLKDKTSSNAIFPVTYNFNSETGSATALMSYRSPISQIPGSSDWASYGNINSNIKEDVGDMLRSNYLFIKDRNFPTSEGKVVKWEDTNDVTRQYSHMLTHNLNSPIYNIKLAYKNLYL